VAEFGADRVAMGSDYPFDMGSPDPVAAVGEASLDSSARALVEGGTAARFLGL
jgi:aminocarboxymuconate-semialdehyde decarboxylase